MELVAAEFGLSIIHPERLTLREQFHLIGSAGLVAGEYGSAMHSTLFADAGLIVCALRGSRFHPGFVQSAIGAALAQPTGYLFGHTNTDDPAQGFIVAAEPFRAFLAGRTR
jgi:capsular polysaccharide biosynthesis protein